MPNIEPNLALVTGHTGFKGGWLSHWLAYKGWNVVGYGRRRTAGPNFYDLAGVQSSLCGETVADLADFVTLCDVVRSTRPEVIFHLAARAIVKESLADPSGVIISNVTSSTNILEAVRRVSPSTKIVLVTTDKVYRNTPYNCQPFDEESQIGGLDPYGASKSAVELIADSYSHTYGVNVATARCANVIGGGDWGAHRLVPTALSGKRMTAYMAERMFLHVLDAVRGYELLAKSLLDGHAFNFGPERAENVADIAARVRHEMELPDMIDRVSLPPERECASLSLDSHRAKNDLGWSPTFGTDEAIRFTVDWHKALNQGADMKLVTMEQIEAYNEQARNHNGDAVSQ